MTPRLAAVLSIAAWFALALFVMSRLLTHSDIATTFAAWAGGVASVQVGRVLMQTWQNSRTSEEP